MSQGIVDLVAPGSVPTAHSVEVEVARCRAILGTDASEMSDSQVLDALRSAEALVCLIVELHHAAQGQK